MPKTREIETGDGREREREIESIEREFGGLGRSGFREREREIRKTKREEK